METDQQTKKLFLEEGQVRKEVTQQELDEIQKNPNLRLKQMEEGVYRKLEKMEG